MWPDLANHLTYKTEMVMIQASQELKPKRLHKKWGRWFE